MPSAPTTNEDFEDWELRFAQRLAGSFLATHGRVGGLDVEDLTSIALDHWWRRRDRYDASRAASPRTFMRKVVGNKFRDVAEKEQAAKRGGGAQVQSMDEALSGDGDATLHEVTGDARPEAHTEAMAEARERSAAMAVFRDTLGESERAVWDAMAEDPRPWATAKRLGMAPTTLRDRLRSIARRAEEQGLRSYLE